MGEGGGKKTLTLVKVPVSSLLAVQHIFPVSACCLAQHTKPCTQHVNVALVEYKNLVCWVCGIIGSVLSGRQIPASRVEICVTRTAEPNSF